MGHTLSVFRSKIAYDRIVTQFSPQGRLFQIEYALEPVKHGATIIGLVCSEGVVLGAEEPLRDELQDSRLSRKIYKLDKHVGAAIVGVLSDARVLIEQARLYAQNNRLMYDEPVDIEVLTKRIGDIKQLCTQHIAVRPFGVSLIIGGIDKTGNKAFKTHPSGAYRSYKATAEGLGRERVEGILKEEYRSNMTLNDAIKLTVKCFMNNLEAKKEGATILIATIPAETRSFTVLPKWQIDNYKKAVKKSSKNR